MVSPIDEHDDGVDFAEVGDGVDYTTQEYAAAEDGEAEEQAAIEDPSITDPRLAAAIGLSSLFDHGSAEGSSPKSATAVTIDSTGAKETADGDGLTVRPVQPSAQPPIVIPPYVPPPPPQIPPHEHYPNKCLGKSAPTLAHVPKTLKNPAGPGVWDNTVYPMPPSRATHSNYTGPIHPLTQSAAKHNPVMPPPYGYPVFAAQYGAPPGGVVPGLVAPDPRRGEDPTKYIGVDATGSAKSFPETLMDVINHEGYHRIISWLPHGRGFMVHDRIKFTKLILKRHFDGAQYASFARRIKRWNFVRVPRGPETGAYYNPYFIRDEPKLIAKMRYHEDNLKLIEGRKFSKYHFQDDEEEDPEEAETSDDENTFGSPAKDQQETAACFIKKDSLKRPTRRELHPDLPFHKPPPILHDGSMRTPSQLPKRVPGRTPVFINTIDAMTYGAKLATLHAERTRARLPILYAGGVTLPPPPGAKTPDQVRLLEIERELLLHKQSTTAGMAGPPRAMPPPVVGPGMMPPPPHPYYPAPGAPPPPGMMAMHPMQPFGPGANMHAMPPVGVRMPPPPGYPPMGGPLGAGMMPPQVPPGAGGIAQRPIMMSRAEEDEFAEYLVNKRRRVLGGSYQA